MGAEDEELSGREQRVRVDVYLHFDEALSIALSGALGITIADAIPPRPAATHAVLVITSTKGQDMAPGQISIDDATATATLEFVDDKGDTDAAAPSNASGAAVATFTSDNPAVATLATSPSNPLVADITPVAEGSANAVCTLAYPDGSEVFEADGVTPFPTPAPTPFTIVAGTAVGDLVVVSA